MTLEEAMKIPYHEIIVGPDEEGHYIGSIVELKGCYAHARTIEDTRAELMDAKEGHLAWMLDNGGPIPRASGWHVLESEIIETLKLLHESFQRDLRSPYLPFCPRYGAEESW